MSRVSVLARTVVVATVAVVGCSTGDYEKAYVERLAAYRRDAEFVAFNRDPTTIGETGLKVRLPREFSRAASAEGTKTTPRPIFIRGVPGLGVAYEADTKVDGQPLPAVVAIGFQPEVRSSQVEETILKQVAADPAVAAAKPAWQKRELDDPGAEFGTWSVLQFKADGLCKLVPTDDATKAKAYPGRAEIWVSAAARQAGVVTLAWLVPEPAAAQLPVANLASLTARTVRSEPAKPTADAKPEAGKPGNAKPGNAKPGNPQPEGKAGAKS